ncbi:Uncharacterized protein CTYZ_00002630 [Cryptosporidium tyzzeri]|nr:Uncharacterized protein CTYZ_00002630 [Cryptosporidium tyzzeri]
MANRFLILNIILLLTGVLSQDSLRSSNESLQLLDEAINTNDTFFDTNNDTSLHQNFTLDKVKIKNKINSDNENKNKTSIKTKIEEESDEYLTNLEYNSENNNTNFIMPFQNNVLKLIDHLSINIGKISFEGLKNVIKGKYVINPIISTEKETTLVDQNTVNDGFEGDSSTSSNGTAESKPELSKYPDVTVLPTEVFIPESAKSFEPAHARGALGVMPLPMQLPPQPAASHPEDNSQISTIIINEVNNHGEHIPETEAASEQGFGGRDDTYGPNNKYHHHHPHNHHHKHHHQHRPHYPPFNGDNSSSSSTSTSSTSTSTSTTTSTTTSTSTSTTNEEVNAVKNIGQKRNLRRLKKVVLEDEEDEDDDYLDEIEQEREDSKEGNQVTEVGLQITMPIITLIASETKYCGNGVEYLNELSLKFRETIGKLFDLSYEEVFIVKMTSTNKSFVNCNDKNAVQKDKSGVKFTFVIGTKMEGSHIFKVLELAINDKESFLVKEFGKIGFIQISKNIA